ncbi:MAG: hypothetical protein MJ127_00230 [Mogibacterium sp.]|nr:hypothetical protein [Mogibacterium sp.]
MKFRGAMNTTFGNLKMNWPRVIAFAVVAAIYTGVIMTIPALTGTSFQDIGIGYEWWIIFAVIITVNCEDAFEAALKCFMFFLLSQPLIYLVEVALGHISIDNAVEYYTQFWFGMTQLTLPGGFIAFFSKKQNALGASVLGVGCGMELLMGITYAIQAMRDMPHHLLSAGASIAIAIIMIWGIQREKKNRIICMAVPIVLLALVLVCLKITGRVII